MTVLCCLPVSACLPTIRRRSQRSKYDHARDPLRKGTMQMSVTRLRIGAVLIVLILCTLLWRGYRDDAARTILLTLPAPKAPYIALLEQVDKGGGATVGFVFEVVIAPLTEPADWKHANRWIWSAYSTYPAKIAWKNDSILTVSLSRRDDPRLYAIRTRTQNGVRAEVELVP